MDIKLEDTELQNNILKFGYRIDYKYRGMISHSFDRFYVITKFELPKVHDLQFTTIPYDKNCEHLEDATSKGGLLLDLINEIKTYCIKIAPYIQYYRKQIEYYNQTATNIKTSFLHHKRQKALQKAVNVMKDKVYIQQNKIFHLEDSMVMYGIYNSDTLEDLIKTVHKLHNTTTWNEKLFSGQIKDWYSWYLTTRGIHQYVINSILFLTTVRGKYVKMYERFLNQLKQYVQVTRVLSKGYLPISLLSPSKLNLILQKVKQAVQVKNKDYDLVTKNYIFTMT